MVIDLRWFIIFLPFYMYQHYFKRLVTLISEFNFYPLQINIFFFRVRWYIIFFFFVFEWKIIFFFNLQHIFFHTFLIHRLVFLILFRAMFLNDHLLMILLWILLFFKFSIIIVLASILLTFFILINVMILII